MDNEKLLGFFILISFYGLVLIPMMIIIGGHLIVFIIEKWSKDETLYQLPYLKNEPYNISEDRLINIIELAYLFNKDTARIISFAIQSKLIFPLYKHSVVTIDEKKYFKCYDMFFEKNLFNCYNNYFNNIYFLKSNIINIKYAFEDTLLSNDFYVSQEKITTENNILEVVRTSIKKLLVINPQITTFKELLDKMTFLLIQVVRCSILKLYGYFFLEKPNLTFQKDKIERYYNELIFNKEKLTLMNVVSSRSKELFTLYVNQLGEVTKNEKLELYFWGRLFIPANELVNILDPEKPSAEAKKQKAYTARKQFKDHFSGKEVKFTEVMPLLHQEFLDDNILD